MSRYTTLELRKEKANNLWMTWQKKIHTGGLLLGVSDKRSSSPKENRIFRRKTKQKNKTKQNKIVKREEKMVRWRYLFDISIFEGTARNSERWAAARYIFRRAHNGRNMHKPSDSAVLSSSRFIPDCFLSFTISVVVWFVGLQGWDIFHEVALCYLLSTRARWRVRNASKWFPTSAISSRHLLCMSFFFFWGGRGSIHHHSWVSVRNDSIMVVHTNTKTLSAFSMVLLLLFFLYNFIRLPSMNANLYIV